MTDTPLTKLYALYEQAEAKAAALAEQAVASGAFAELLATTATNVMAVAGVVNAVVDRGVRATRLAARADVVGLARQLARTEDKLERLLQEVEELSARLAVPPPVTVTLPAPARNGSRTRTPR
jgi:uncharacterized protein YlxW (UPF0749 family)